jgi:hypothetical protein
MMEFNYDEINRGYDRSFGSFTIFKTLFEKTHINSVKV